jgi:hypothetical protein
MRSFFGRIKVDVENIGYRIKYNLITEEEIRENINSYNWFVRREIARQGFGLDILKNDNDLYVSDEAKRQLKKQGLL